MSPRPVFRQAALAFGLSLAASVVRAQEVPTLTPQDASPFMGSGAGGSLLGGGRPGSTGAPALPGQAAPAAAAPVAPAAAPAAQQDRDAPVTFTADEVEYDRETGVVTARGNVEAWQGERFLRADNFTYDRNTGVVRVSGHVQLIDEQGQVMFADEAELKDRMRDGVLEGVRALLASNGRLAANGAQRSGGTVNELSRVVYSSCNLCAEDPTRPPLWQIRSRRTIQDTSSQRITHRDAEVRMFGVPIFYTPYFSHPDPSAPRASGFLFPTLGVTRYLGAFAETPYFWAIDDTSDLLVTPIFPTSQPPNLGLEYRKLFNSGEISATGSLGWFNETAAGGTGGTGFAGHIFSKGRFAINENWRVGFDLNRASNDLYLRTYRYEYRRVLTSQAYAEGFWGTESYFRADSRVYQGLRSTDDNSQIPYVLPNIFFEHAPRQKLLGGFLTVDTSTYSIYREQGTQTNRLGTRVRWERPEVGRLGEVWTLRMQSDLYGYYARGQGDDPINLPNANGTQAIGNVRVGLDWRYPLVRDAGSWGRQLIEPRMQFVTGPNTGRQTTVPNEDAIDFEFTDANLFALNRFNGRDRQEGGSRADAAIRAAWYFPNGGQVEGLVGKSYALSNPSWNPYPLSGLQDRWSENVARLRVAPVPWFETMGRVRTNSTQPFAVTFTDVVSTVSLGPVSVSGGYLDAPPVPYLNPSTRRLEVSSGIFARINENWRVGVSGRYDLKLDRPVLFQASAVYEDECFILDGRFMRRYAENSSTNTLYPASTILLVRIGFKTLGEYYFRAI
jgi:LPS-assembly protein